MSLLIVAATGMIVCCLAASMPAGADSMEIPTLQWGDSKRADGTTRHWNPEPLIDLRATLVCVAYRPITPTGERWHAVGMTGPKLLAKTLLNTKPELDTCHKHKIKVIGYADTIMFHPDMLEPEGIAADDLYAIDRKGNRVVNTMWDKDGAGVSCVRNPKWIKLQKQVARVTADAGFDGLQFDVYPYAIDPGYLCCCHYCNSAWSTYSESLFGEPQPMPGLDSGKLDFNRPVDRAFKTWRLQNFTDFVKSIEADVRNRHPNFIIIMNHGGGTPDFTYEAVHGALKYPSTELWHLKLGDDSSLYLYSSTEAANDARMIGLINFAEQMKPDYRYRVALAEAHAGGGTFYAVTGNDTSKAYCDFFRAHQDWYNDTKSEAEVAVLYSWRDQAFLQGDLVAEAKVEFDPKRDHYQRAASVLAKMGVPHDCLIVERGLSGRLSRYKVIVVPELSLVDDEDAVALEKYVRAGGKLLIIGEMGTFFASGQEFINRETSLSALWAGDESMGKGMIAFAPSALDDSPRPSEGEGSGVRVWMTACEQVGLVSQLRIESSTPIESAIRGKGDRRSIHLIRFGDIDVGRPEAGTSPEGLRDVKDRAVAVEYEIPRGYVADEVSVWSPDFPSTEMSFASETIGGHLRVKISRLDNYALVGVVLKRDK